MIPAVFRRIGVIGMLNVPAISFVLSAGIGTAFSDTHFGLGHRTWFADACALVTLAMGPLWAIAMRVFPIAFQKKAWRGWLVCLGLAMANAGVAGAVYLSVENSRPGEGLASIFMIALIGSVYATTLGVALWGPALLITTLLVGLPTAWAKRLARRGLAGEERGEWILGILFAALALVVGLVNNSVRGAHHPAFNVLAILAFLSGAIAAFLAIARELTRRHFVRQAEEGIMPGYRVTPSREGKVLVRVASHGTAYRATEHQEAICAVDAEGAVV